jgi:Holliday junction resolvasome RuvABC endonuclease subunit
MILYEKPIWMHGENFKVLSGMETVIELYAASMEIEIRSIHNMTLKKQFTGKGNASKELMLNRANFIGKEMGFHTDSFDVADAFAVGYELLKEIRKEIKHE